MWMLVVHSGVRYELTHMLRLNNIDGVRDISYVAVNVLMCLQIYNSAKMSIENLTTDTGQHFCSPQGLSQTPSYLVRLSIRG